MKSFRLGILAVILATLLPVAGAAEDTPRTIAVMGTGEVDVAPDMAMVSLAVTHQDRRADVAMAAVSRDMATVLSTLKQAGLADRDMQTDAVRLSPLWEQTSERGARQIAGFVASNGVTVRVRDLAALGSILDAVIADGANTFSGLRFALQDPASAEAEARAAAVADAIARARQMAQAAGLRLGEVRTITENGGARPFVTMEMADAARASMPVAPGELTVQATVSIVFDLLPGE